MSEKFTQLVNDALHAKLGQLTMEKILADAKVQELSEQLDACMEELKFMHSKGAPPAGVAGEASEIAPPPANVQRRRPIR